MSYQWSVEEKLVRRVSDGAFIPNDPMNKDWRAFEAWRKAGGEPLPAEVVKTQPKPSLDDVIAVLKERNAGFAEELAQKAEGK